MEITRLFDILPHYAAHFPKDDALAGKENGVWVKYSVNQYIETVNNVCYGFMQLGIQKGDKIASITNNRPEWNILDMAIMQLGCIHVSIYPTISETDYQYILHHSDVKFVFVSGWELLRKIEHLLPEIPNLRDNVYTFKNLRGYKHLNEIIELGKANPSPQYLQDIKESIKPDDVMTIIYTSGTTGKPKGVMLTHENILSNVKAVVPITPSDSKSKALSYLPLCHAYERMMIYTWQYVGCSVYYAENLATIADNFKELKPEIFTSVPRLLEKFYEKILSVGRKQKGLKRKIFLWANEIALAYDIDKEKNFWYGLKLKIARRLVLKKWKAAFGGNLRVIVSGGASIQPRLCRVFLAAEIPILEGYGATETSPVIAVSNFFKDGIKFSTVGPPLPGVQIKIAEDEEILVKGKNIMKGYYKDEELTKSVIDEDGWFHTGDLGKFESKGQLRITGRKKEMFKTAFGKYVVPTIIENKFSEDPLIDQIMVCGENKQFAAALIVPNFVELRSWCNYKDISYTTNEEMVLHPRILQKYQKIVTHYNQFFGETEKIKRWTLINYEWTIQSGEITPTLKLRRSYIVKKHADKIEKLFS